MPSTSPGREGGGSGAPSPAAQKAPHMPAGTQSIHVTMAHYSQQFPSPSPSLCVCHAETRAAISLFRNCNRKLRPSAHPPHLAGFAPSYLWALFNTVSVLRTSPERFAVSHTHLTSGEFFHFSTCNLSDFLSKVALA